jgi:hypothetical protein
VTPLLLLDVDGVLNALWQGQPPDAWPEWSRGSATADGRRWPITWAPAVVDRLRGWHADGVVELQWLTTWGHDANGELRELLGLPELVVAGTYQDADQDAGMAEDLDAHAAVAPAAPDPLSGQWWKYDVVRRLRDAQPGRSIVWVDDELHRPNRFTAWAADSAVLAVGPHPGTGLTESDLAVIEERVTGQR